MDYARLKRILTLSEANMVQYIKLLLMRPAPNMGVLVQVQLLHF